MRIIFVLYTRLVFDYLYTINCNQPILSVFACSQCPGSGSGCFVAMSNDIATARGLKSNDKNEDTLEVIEEHENVTSNFT